MAPTPRPKGWKGGSENFGFLRTFDGHLGVNVETDEEFAAEDSRRNVKYGFRDIGGDYEADVEEGGY